MYCFNVSSLRFSKNTKQKLRVPCHFQISSLKTSVITILANWKYRLKYFFLSFTVVVVVTFFICWAPHHAQRLLAVYGNNGQRSSDGFNHIFDYLTYASGVLYFTSTCINPFLYSLMSYKFREAFKVRCYPF